jgi:hypothetical protein
MSLVEFAEWSNPIEISRLQFIIRAIAIDAECLNKLDNARRDDSISSCFKSDIPFAVRKVQTIELGMAVADERSSSKRNSRAKRLRSVIFSINLRYLVISGVPQETNRCKTKMRVIGSGRQIPKEVQPGRHFINTLFHIQRQS